MREITAYELASAETGYSENPMPTQAVTIEWQFRSRSGGSGIPIVDHDNRWEEMLFPAEVVEVGGLPTLKIAAKYMENPLRFVSKDSPETYYTLGAADVYGNNPIYTYPAVTGLEKMFLNIANDTVWWNPEKDAVSWGPDDRGFKQLFKTTVPAQIWARRIKVYSFAENGSITGIDYYVMDEKGVAWGSGGYVEGMGTVNVSNSGGYYYIPLLDSTNDGTAAVLGTAVSPQARVSPIVSILPDMEDDEPFHLLANAQDAAAYQAKVTLEGTQVMNDVYGDRQRARQALAEALWG